MRQVSDSCEGPSTRFEQKSKWRACCCNISKPNLSCTVGLYSAFCTKEKSFELGVMNRGNALDKRPESKVFRGLRSVDQEDQILAGAIVPDNSLHKINLEPEKVVLLFIFQNSVRH